MASTFQATGPAIDDLRSLLAVFGTAHPETKSWASPSVPASSWVSVEVCAVVASMIPAQMKDRYLVSASAGKGDPNETPWIAVMRRDITTSPQTGVYIVYLFAPDRERITLCIMLGVTRPNEGSKERRSPLMRDTPLLRDRASQLRRLIPPTRGFDEVSLSLNGRTLRSTQYEVGYIYGRTYEVTRLPTSADLETDFRRILDTYDRLEISEATSIENAPRPSAPRAINRNRKRASPTLLADHIDVEAAMQRRERASRSHEELVQFIARLASGVGVDAEETQHIDVLLCKNIIIEVKSLQHDDPQQIRDGIAQLLFYRFLYRKEIECTQLVLALGRKPGERLRDLIDFATFSGIHSDVAQWEDI